MAGTCGYGEGLSGSINAENFLTSCKVYWLASQKDSAPWSNEKEFNPSNTLDLHNFVIDKLADNVALVPKRVGVGI
jgi:hypothetical protein